MRIAVVGAGPIGLEAAAEAEARGHEVEVFEAGQIAEHIRRWGHVTLFTPWRMAVTERGLARLAWAPDDPDATPRGAELVDQYLAPLAQTLAVHEGHRVLSIARGHLRKGQALGARSRAEDPFRILVAGPDGEYVAEADAVLDCTGVFGSPAPAGAGGASAPGEAAAVAAGRVSHGPVAVDGFAGRDVLLVGDGASAVTTLGGLLALEPPPRITWVTPKTEVPGFTSPDDDVLPSRQALYALGHGAPARPEVTHRPGVLVDAIALAGDRVSVTLTDGSTAAVDQILSCTGFRPDHALSRELQLHVCWGTEGPMKLAAALLAASDGGGDCMSQPAQGADTLRNPEPRFFVLGNKSYGRRSDFLLSIGHQQVRDALNLIETD